VAELRKRWRTWEPGRSGTSEVQTERFGEWRLDRLLRLEPWHECGKSWIAARFSKDFETLLSIKSSELSAPDIQLQRSSRARQLRLYRFRPVLRVDFHSECRATLNILKPVWLSQHRLLDSFHLPFCFISATDVYHLRVTKSRSQHLLRRIPFTTASALDKIPFATCYMLASKAFCQIYFPKSTLRYFLLHLPVATSSPPPHLANIHYTICLLYQQQRKSGKSYLQAIKHSALIDGELDTNSSGVINSTPSPSPTPNLQP
jgi:hypothetical protein